MYLPYKNKYTHGSMRTKIFDKTQEGLATFGAGCYWGTEKFFVKNFKGFSSIYPKLFHRSDCPNFF